MTAKTTLLLIVSLLATTPAIAQDNAQAALARAQGMLRQISAQKAALESQVAQLQQELEAANAELRLQQKNSETRESKYKGAISEWKQEFTALKEKYYETVDVLRATLQERDEVTTQLTATTRNFQTCYNDNQQLVELNKDLLGKYRDKGFWAALSEKEPVTGFGKVEKENLLQAYTHNIDDLDLGMNEHTLVPVK